MSIHVSLLDEDKDWPNLGRLLLQSPADGYSSFFHRFFPPNAARPHIYPKQRQTKVIDYLETECVNDPSSYILKAVNETTGEIVGCCWWRIQTTPTSKQKEDIWGVTPYPPSPHIFLYFLATIPSPSFTLVPELLINWGLERGDSLGIDVWSYTLAPEAPLYTSHGFQPTELVEFLRPQDDESSTYWKVCRAAVNNRDIHKSFYLDTRGFW